MISERMRERYPFLTEHQADQFEQYYRMLIDWNERMNLTAITDEEGVFSKHFCDSLAAADCLPQGTKLIDVGTGAGFPGVPLKIVRPDLEVTLLDSLNKRILFLDALLKELGIQAETVHMRAEEAGRSPAYRERFDAATTRAVTQLPALIELTVPLLKVGGISIAYKGDVREELEGSARALSLLRAEAETLPVEADYGERTLVLIRKKGKTPKTYPRKPGMPVRDPL